ncbi:MAG: fumarylacetoacetate hydrolase family protein [Porticoccaceae bacterium]|jgi:2-keto-4-pentenoate hydratase/2-oxohepta-3-ene-1,7-dioic acid hydratase in catechol pathway|tara:strand:+ start:936 stop:1610 length:675 start_codon:yes stop_codon:yes gene_type:complete
MGNYHHIVNGRASDLPLGKVVCVGRNYAAHAKELNNPVPTEPVLFIKPSTSLVKLEEPLAIPSHLGECHFEAEMSILIGQSLSNCNHEQASEAIAGIGLALDLTLRELQQELKEKGLPWEKAKSFDGSCPVSGFVPISQGTNLQDQQILLLQNQQIKQNGNTEDMLTSVLALLSYISQFFTLLPGDIVLTGTPAGVGPLKPGDQLSLSLSDSIHCITEVGSSAG